MAWVNDGNEQYCRKKLRRCEVHLGARFLTFSCNQRLPLFRNDTLKGLFVKYLEQSRRKQVFLLRAWVLMPEHVHLLLVPLNGIGIGSPVPQILQSLKKPLAERALKRWREVGWEGLRKLADSQGELHFWQPGGGFDRNIRSADEYEETVWYIHQNPVKRGLVQRPLDWPWSSARWYSGVREGELAIDADTPREVALKMEGARAEAEGNSRWRV